MPLLPRHPRPVPAVVAPRRADTTAVIGSALQASARGTGYRRIAAQVQRPLSTVRRWIRAVRDPVHVEWLRTQGMVWLARVDLDVINTLAPQATRLGDALTALAAAALTLRAGSSRTSHRGRWSARSPVAGSSGHRCRPGRAEIPLPPGPRAPATRRHRDDSDPARSRPARGSVTTTAPP